MTTGGRRDPGRRGRRSAPQGTPLPLASIVAAGVALVAVVAVAVLALAPLLSSDDENTSQDGAAAVDTPSQDTEPPADAPAQDREAIESLARASIEVLPAGEWPSLYRSFTAAFQERCPEAEFDQAGVDAAADLGADLQLLRFVRVEKLVVEGDSASATIIGEQEGQGEYEIQAAFQREDGQWKIAAAPDTAGCEAFGRVDG